MLLQSMGNTFNSNSTASQSGISVVLVMLLLPCYFFPHLQRQHSLHPPPGFPSATSVCPLLYSPHGSHLSFVVSLASVLSVPCLSLPHFFSSANTISACLMTSKTPYRLFKRKSRLLFSYFYVCV